MASSMLLLDDITVGVFVDVLASQGELEVEALVFCCPCGADASAPIGANTLVFAFGCTRGTPSLPVFFCICCGIYRSEMFTETLFSPKVGTFHHDI